MSDVPPSKSCDCGSKIGLVNLVLNSVILLVLLIHFLGNHYPHFSWRWHGGPPGGPMGFHCPFHGPGMGPAPMSPAGPGHAAWGGWGHEPQNPKVVQDQALDHVTRMLSLTDQQKNQLRPIVNDAVTALEKNRQQSHEAAKQIIDAAKAKAMPFLTADQKKIVDSLPEHKA